MKRLSDNQIELIDAWVAKSAINEITPALLEKDIHITDALVALMKIEHPHLTLVFCGGTSLSKAYGLIERMSEDIDLKIVQRTENLSRSALKRHLGDLKESVAETLSEIGFVEDDNRRKSLNENRYIGMQWFYVPVYEAHGSLRPHLSIEFTARTPRLRVEQRSIGYLLDRLLAKPDSQDVVCVIPAETVAEKVLSFLRRYAQFKAGKMLQPWDTALVRHVYDSYCIHRADAGCLEEAKAHFADLAADDIAQFGKQFPHFASSPRSVLQQSLAEAEFDQKLSDEYRQYLLPLIFGKSRPSYEEAFEVFKQCAKQLLSRLDCADSLIEKIGEYGDGFK